jgi:hypothetical protein
MAIVTIAINCYVEVTNTFWQVVRARTTDLLHTYHSRFIPEGVAEVSQIFLRDTHALPKLVSYEEHCSRDRW